MTKTDGGIAGLQFVRNIIIYLKKEWQTNRGGNVPNFTAQWGKKVTGYANSNYEEIIISLDSENPNIYSLLQSDDVDGFFWDWLHDISITLDCRTGSSSDRILQIIDEVVRIMKKSVISVINDEIYVQILPGAIVSLNEEYRNLYRYTLDIEALQFNP